MGLYKSLKNRIPKNFFEEYRGSDWFAYSTPISSFLWFSSVIPKTESLPFIDNTLAYWVLVSLALSAILGPMLGYYVLNKPFHVIVGWRPVEAEPLDLRLKSKGLIQISDSDAQNPPVIIKFFFKKNTEKYKLKFSTKGPLEVSPALEPTNAKYDEEAGLLECNNIEDYDFFLPLNVDEIDENRGELERSIQVSDLTFGRDIELVNIDIL